VTGAARTPWPVAVTALAAVALVLPTAAFAQTAGALPFVTRVAGLALAAGAAYLLDDAAAPLTAVVPQGRWRRRAPELATGGAMLAGAWLGILLVLEWRAARPPVPESSAELLVTGLVGFGASALLVRLGDPEPGARVAPAVVLAGLGLVIAGSLANAPIYLTDAEPTPGRAAAWSVAGLLAMAVTVASGRARTCHARWESGV
jgi:hypothetical protein